LCFAATAASASSGVAKTTTSASSKDPFGTPAPIAFTAAAADVRAWTAPIACPFRRHATASARPAAPHPTNAILIRPPRGG
jgi:hypothetical protein